jgi:hypothetical protein
MLCPIAETTDSYTRKRGFNVIQLTSAQSLVAVPSAEADRANAPSLRERQAELPGQLSWMSRQIGVGRPNNQRPAMSLSPYALG